MKQSTLTDEQEKLFDSMGDELDEILKNIESDFKNADKEILDFIKNNSDKFTFNGIYRSHLAWQDSIFTKEIANLSKIC